MTSTVTPTATILTTGAVKVTATNTIAAVVKIPGPPANLNPQMGVSFTLDAVFSFQEYLQALVDNGTYKTSDRDNYSSYSDGYRMTWAFDTPSVVPTKAGAIDSVCLGSTYGLGAICVGVIYTGVGTLTANKWAMWLNSEQLALYDPGKPLMGTDETTNWWTTSTTFNGVWSAYRWQPKQQLQVNWYKNTFRFSPEDTTSYIRLYQSKDTITYTLKDKITVKLMNARDLISSSLLCLGIIYLLDF